MRGKKERYKAAASTLSQEVKIYAAKLKTIEEQMA